VADFLKDFEAYRFLYGASGQQLVTDRRSFASIFADDGFELGIIAGDRCLNPMTAYLIGKPNDGKVSVESTRMRSAAAHAVVHCTHTGLPMSRRVKKLTAAFIREGRFADAA
jgi:hypothetical protein